MQFICLHPIYSRKNVCIPVHWVDAIAFGRSDEGKMDSYGLGAFIGSCKETVLSNENPAFDRSLRLVVVYSNVGILQEPCKGSPVLQSVVDGLHQVMRWMEAAFSPDDDFAQELNEGLRFFAAHCQPKGGWFAPNFPFDSVQVPVNIENGGGNVVFGKPCFEVSSPGVSAAASFGSLPVLEQGVESTGCICLDNSVKVFKGLKIFTKGQVWRVFEEGNFAVLVGDVGSELALANVVFMAAVLNLNGGVISLDDVRFEQFFLEHGIEQGKCGGGILHPIALCGTWNGDVLASKNLLLAVIGKSIIELADNDLRQQSGPA